MSLILTQKPKTGTTVEVWTVHRRGVWVGIVPALEGVGAQGPDENAVYQYCKTRTMDIVITHQNKQMATPWRAIDRKPPVGCKIRRFTFNTGIR